MYAHAHVVLSQEPGRDQDLGAPGRALLPLPEPRWHRALSQSSLPLEALTCGAIQLASRSEEATFEFVRKTKNKKTTKAPNQTNTTRHGRCFLPPRLPQYGAVGRERLATDGAPGTSPVF